MLKKFRSSTQIGLALLLSLFSTNILPVASAYAFTAPSGSVDKVNICHRNNNDNDPYVHNDPAADALGVGNGNGDHASHDGLVWSPGMKTDHDKWGDIIPPFTDNGGRIFDGLNWSLSDNGDLTVTIIPANTVFEGADARTSINFGKAVDSNEPCLEPDVCPNLDTYEIVIPAGLVKDDEGNCVTDSCPLVPGVQTDTTLCPAGGNVLSDNTGGHVLEGVSTTRAVLSATLPATLPATGSSSNSLAIIFMMVTAYGAMYFFQGRRNIGSAFNK